MIFAGVAFARRSKRFMHAPVRPWAACKPRRQTHSAFTVQYAWRQFWDHQLVKVLDAQFARDVLALVANVPTQHIALTFSGQQVQFEPPLEDVRAAVYTQQLDPFLSFPTKVRCKSTSSNC